MDNKQRCTTIPTLKGETKKRNKAFRTQRYLLGKFTQSDRRKESQSMYNSPRWTSTRLAQIQAYPLCQLSLVENRIEPAEHVHHLIKFLDQTDEIVKHQLFLDPDNLISLSTEMHMALHYAPDRLTERLRAWLSDQKNKVFDKYISQGAKIVFTDDKNDIL